MTYISRSGTRHGERDPRFQRTSIRLCLNEELYFFDCQWEAREFLYLCLDSGGELRAALFNGKRKIMTLEQAA